MLVITKICDDTGEIPCQAFYKSRLKKEHLIYELNFNYSRKFYIDVYDSIERKVYNDLSLLEIYSLVDGNFERILGVVPNYDNNLVFIPVNYVTWKLLDYIDEIKYCGEHKNINEFLQLKYKNISLKTQGVLDKCTIYNYEYSSKNILLAKLFYKLEKLDEHGIFWILSLGDYVCYNINSIYELVICDSLYKCDYLYIADPDGKLYEFSINSNIKRILTKSKMLGDKLCWQ